MVSPPDRDQTDRTETEVSALREDEVLDYRGTAESLLPVSEASVIQLQPGPAPTNLEIFSSDKISVLGLRHPVRSVGIVIMKPGCFTLMWRDGNEDCRINGQPVRPTLELSREAASRFRSDADILLKNAVRHTREDLASAPQQTRVKRSSACSLTHIFAGPRYCSEMIGRVDRSKSCVNA